MNSKTQSMPEVEVDTTISPKAIMGADEVFTKTRKVRAIASAVFGGWSGYSWWVLALRAGTLTQPQLALVVTLATVTGAATGYGWSTLGVEVATNRIAKKYMNLLTS